MFEENVTNFKQRLRMRGYRDKVIDKHLSEVKHHEIMSAFPEGRGVGVGGYILGLSHKRVDNFLKYPLPGRGKYFIRLNCLKITDPPLGINNEQSLTSSFSLFFCYPCIKGQATSTTWKHPDPSLLFQHYNFKFAVV